MDSHKNNDKVITNFSKEHLPHSARLDEFECRVSRLEHANRALALEFTKVSDSLKALKGTRRKE